MIYKTNPFVAIFRIAEVDEKSRGYRTAYARCEAYDVSDGSYYEDIFSRNDLLSDRPGELSQTLKDPQCYAPAEAEFTEWVAANAERLSKVK